MAVSLQSDNVTDTASDSNSRIMKTEGEVGNRVIAPLLTPYPE